MINKREVKRFIDVAIIEHLETLEKRVTLVDMRSASSTQRDVDKVKAAIRERVAKLRGTDGTNQVPG